MVRSRLLRRMEQRTQKNLFLSVLGIILVILLAFKLGIPLLVNISLFLSGSKDNHEVKKQELSFIAPPVFNPFPQATSSATIIVSGIASENQSVKLYINDALIDEVKTENDGNFSFKETIKPGENIIKAKAVVKDKESDFSKEITTSFKSAPPSLDISSPANNQSFSKDQNTIDVKGTTDADVKVTINGFRAITEDSGKFSYRLPLQNGENNIKIEAVDIAGNKTEKEIKVTYNP